MAKVVVNKNKCKGCLLCVQACPKKLFSAGVDLNPNGFVAVLMRDKRGECLGCAMCALVCPECCIEVYR